MPVLVSSSELESSSLAKGFLKKPVASGCKPESFFKGTCKSVYGLIPILISDICYLRPLQQFFVSF